MRSLYLLPLILAGCASTPPSQLVSLNQQVNQSNPYQFYVGLDLRILKPGEKGNCAALAATKTAFLLRNGQPAEIHLCTLPGGQQHLYAVSDGWVMLNHGDPIPETSFNCIRNPL